VKVAIDSNVLAYGEGINDAGRARVAREVVGRIPVDDIVVPVQALGEVFNVLTRKGGLSAEHARAAVLNMSDSFELAGTTAEVVFQAIDLAADHHLSIWDAIILCAASSAGCRLLLSEDLQDGFTWAGVTVVNPFAAVRHPLLASLLAE
jgi:predicted nucleic acid-binding protein